MIGARGRAAPPGRIAYVDGRYLPHGLAGVHIEDRGLQLADSVYEVCAVASGLLLDEADHLDRLERSLAALEMKPPLTRRALEAVMRETIRRNRLRDGYLYLQVTRGVHSRDHAIPKMADTTLIMTTRRLDAASLESRRANGISVVTLPDNRWGRCDIKTTALTANVLAKTAARRAGAYEAWFVDAGGHVMEGASTNAWIVTADNVAVTRALHANILPGVTRGGVLKAAHAAGVAIEERAFSVEEAKCAREAFITSATGGVIPVVQIDAQFIGDGKPGPLSVQLHALYRKLATREAVR